MNFDEPIDRRGSESYKWREYPDDVIPLFVADMDFRSPEPVVRALRDYVDAGVFGYPRGLHATDRAQLDELTTLVADRMRDRYGWFVAPEAVVPVPGAVSGLNIACHMLADSREPGRRGVLVQTPVYPQILIAPIKAGLTREEAPLVADDAGRYTVDWDAFSDAARRSGMFILCNPHNPVGRVFQRDELMRMARICADAGTIICADEVHSDLLFDGHAHLPIAAFGSEIVDRTITLVGPSKTFNLAGLQCAFAIIPDPELRRRYRRFRNAAVPWVNAPGLIAAEAAYRHGDAWRSALLDYLRGNRDFLRDYLHGTAPEIRVTPLEATYLAWLDCRGLGLDDPYEFFLTHARVALSNGRDFGPGGVGFVRLNFACRRAALEEALERMTKAIDRHCRRRPKAVG
jgi:cystathionine beta-lyase